jgi:hypothetical protein
LAAATNCLTTSAALPETCDLPEPRSGLQRRYLQQLIRLHARIPAAPPMGCLEIERGMKIGKLASIRPPRAAPALAFAPPIQLPAIRRRTKSDPRLFGRHDKGVVWIGHCSHLGLWFD